MADPTSQLQAENDRLRAELAELRQAHERLQQSERRYRQVVENAPISVLFIDSAGYVTEMNQAAEQLFGLPFEQMQQAFPIFENPQLVENGTLPYMLRALAGETVIEQPNHYDTSRDFPKGRKTTLGKGHYFPIWDEAGQVVEIVEIAPDFSDLLTAQQAFAQERARLLSAIAQVANLLLKSSDYMAVLPDVVRLLGEAVGSDRCIILQDVLQPNSEQIALTVLTEYCKLEISTTSTASPEFESGFLLEGDWVEFHQQFLRGDVLNSRVADLAEPMRSFFTIQGINSLLIVPIMVQGKCWGNIGFDNCGEPRLFDDAEIAILKVAADSIAAAIERQQKEEELQQSEALYRSLFEISNEGIYRWELDQPVPLNLSAQAQVDLIYAHCRFTQANEAYLAMMGISAIEDMANLRLSDLHVEDSAKNDSFMLSCVENNWRIRNIESEEVDVNDGQKRYYLNSLISFIENDCVTGGWGTQIDITELRQAQQDFLQAEQNRAALLTTVTAVANQLLRATDYTTVLPDVLRLLGEVAQADRCSLVRNVTDPLTGQPAAQLQSEWCRDDVQLSIVHTPSLETALPWDLFPDGYATLSQGKTLEFRIDELAEPTRSILQAQGNITMLMVPIVVQDQFWGLFGFDYCHEERSLDPETTGIFAIAVDSIAAAIERDRMQQEERESLIVQERTCMAREIHDTLAQAFGGIITQLQASAYFFPTQPDKAQYHLNRAHGLTQTGLTEARRSVWSLSQEGTEFCHLATLIPKTVQELTAPHDLQAHCHIQGSPYPVEPEVGMNLLRILQEAIANTLRHAAARSLQVTLSYSTEGITLQICDDGRGFKLHRNHEGFGLIGMRQRADHLGATLQITSHLHQGTTIEIHQPIHPTPSSIL